MISPEITTLFVLLSLIRSVESEFLVNGSSQSILTPLIAELFKLIFFSLAWEISQRYQSYSQVSGNNAVDSGGAQVVDETSAITQSLNLVMVAVAWTVHAYLSLYLQANSPSFLLLTMNALVVVFTAILFSTWWGNRLSASQWTLLIILVIGVFVLEYAGCDDKDLAQTSTQISNWILSMHVVNALLQSIFYLYIWSWIRSITSKTTQTQAEMQASILQFGNRFYFISLFVSGFGAFFYSVFVSHPQMSPTSTSVQVLFYVLKASGAFTSLLALSRMDAVVENLSFTIALIVPVLLRHVLTFFQETQVIRLAASLVVLVAVKLYLEISGRPVIAAKEDGFTPLKISGAAASESIILPRGLRRRRTFMFAVAIIMFGGIANFIRLSLVSNPVPIEEPLLPIGKMSAQYNELTSKIRNHFREILVIVSHDHRDYQTHAKAWNELYENYFPNKRHFHPRHHKSSAFFDHPGAAADRPIRKRAIYEDVEDWAEQYLACKEFPDYRGYLWIHSDLYLNMTNLLQLSLDKPWGPASACRKNEHSSLKACKGDASLRIECIVTSLKACRVGVEEIYRMIQGTMEVLPPSSSTEAACQAQTSDLFYVPKTRTHFYMVLLQFFAKHNVPLELAIPELARLLGEGDATRSEQLTWIQETRMSATGFDESIDVCGGSIVRVDAAHVIDYENSELIHNVTRVLEWDLGRLMRSSWLLSNLKKSTM